MCQIVRNDLRFPNRRTGGRVAGDAADHANHRLGESRKRERNEQECSVGGRLRDSRERPGETICSPRLPHHFVFIHSFALLVCDTLHKSQSTGRATQNSPYVGGLRRPKSANASLVAPRFAGFPAIGI